MNAAQLLIRCVEAEGVQYVQPRPYNRDRPAIHGLTTI